VAFEAIINKAYPKNFLSHIILKNTLKLNVFVLFAVLEFSLGIIGNNSIITIIKP
jgi:hypothetical protein